MTEQQPVQDPEELFEELLRSRIIVHAEHMNGDELLRVERLAYSIRVDNGSIQL